MKMASRMAIGLAGAFGLAAATGAYADPWFDVNFDNVVIPASPGYVAVPVNATPTGTATTVIESRQKTGATARVYGEFTDSSTGKKLGGNGDQVLILEDTSVATSSPASQYTIAKFGGQAPLTSGKWRLTFDMMIDSSGATADKNNISMYLYDTSGATTNNYLASISFDQYDQEIAIRSLAETTQSVTMAGPAFALGQKIQVKIDLDLDAHRFSLFINDNLQWGAAHSDGTYTSDINPNYGLSSFMIQTLTTTTGRVGLNNVVMDALPIPEPASIGLAALAGLFLLRRR